MYKQNWQEEEWSPMKYGSGEKIGYRSTEKIDYTYNTVMWIPHIINIYHWEEMN